MSNAELLQLSYASFFDYVNIEQTQQPADPDRIAVEHVAHDLNEEFVTNVPPWVARDCVDRLTQSRSEKLLHGSRHLLVPTA